MCLFCSIINGEIPSYKVYEDENVYAFLDISQVTKGHTLVVSKKHFDNFLACDDETVASVMIAAKKIGNHLMEKTGAKGMNILSNVNEVAGQSVFHVHVHLIPRYSENDACTIAFNESEKQDFDALLKEVQM